MPRLVWYALAAWFASAFPVWAGDASIEPLVFERHVRPILKAHCFQCHGEEGQPEGRLDVRLARWLIQGGESGPAVVPGQATASLIVDRLSSGEMPPGEKSKKLSAAEIATIANWINAGAKTARPEPESPAAVGEVTEEDRSFWSFQPVHCPPVPQVRQQAWVRTPIDAFLLAELEKRKLGYSPEADRRTLIRRASFDLLGLPPSPEAVERFLADARPDAWERLIDELLASPQYGERWGRHWLDVAGYADSDGYSEKDLERKYAYKYRDYVIRAFNGDKPLDEFLREQLAGDEMLVLPYANLTAEQVDKLAATGFLRMGPDGTGDESVEQNLARNEVLAETIKIVSTSLLGLSVGCAQCHNHRYDPIPQVDYYRLRAIFEPAYDWKSWRPPGSRLVSLWTDDVRKKAELVDAKFRILAKERSAALDALVQETLERELEALPEVERRNALAARQTPPEKRTAEQKQVLKQHPSLNVNTKSVYLYDQKRFDQHNKKYNALSEALKAERPIENFVSCLTEVPGKIPSTMVFVRGDFNLPGKEVEPGELTVIADKSLIPNDDPQLRTSGRRLAYARWLTSGDHPLVARVLVNRVWMHHFGRGIVGTPADFGALGERPTHPELLDWLADSFVAEGWRLKRLHKLILTSTAWRQSSARNDALDAADPDNRLLGRMMVRRLEAEVLRDSILAASGRLSSKMQGPAVPVMPDDVGQVVLGVDTRDTAGRPTGKAVPLGEDEFRRSVYVQVRRSMPLGMLETFDAPRLNPNCELRTNSTVTPQSLLLMNNEFVVNESVVFALRIEAEAGNDAKAQVQLAWQRAFGRMANETEERASLLFLKQQTADFAAHPPAIKSKQPLIEPATRALACLCQALFSSNGFLYVD